MKRVLAIIVLILSYLLPNITSVIFAYRKPSSTPGVAGGAGIVIVDKPYKITEIIEVSFLSSIILFTCSITLTESILAKSISGVLVT